MPCTSAFEPCHSRASRRQARMPREHALSDARGRRANLPGGPGSPDTPFRPGMPVAPLPPGLPILPR
jgi:hypothetical protein